MENNPNCLDLINTPERCILYINPIGELIRKNRNIFLHKGSFKKFQGYAFSQMHKADLSLTSSNPKRKALVEAFSYDTKKFYHVVRLSCEAEQILLEGRLDLEKNREILKAIRKGEWKIEKVKEWFDNKNIELEKLYLESKLPNYPDEAKIKDLLLECLEMHYGKIGIKTSSDIALHCISEMESTLESLKRSL